MWDDAARAALGTYTQALLAQALSPCRVLNEQLQAARGEEGAAHALTLGHLVAAALTEGVCVRCALRMSGTVRTVLYSVPYPELLAASEAALAAARVAAAAPPLASPCRACWGALQDVGQHMLPVGWDGQGSPAATLVPAQPCAGLPPLLSSSQPDPAMCDWSSEAATGASWLQPVVDYILRSGWDLRTGLAVALHFDPPCASASAKGKNGGGGSSKAGPDNTSLTLLQAAYEEACVDVGRRLLARAATAPAFVAAAVPAATALACLHRRNLLDLREALRVLVGQRVRCLAVRAPEPGVVTISVPQLQAGLAACGLAPQDLHATHEAPMPAVAAAAHAGTPGAFLASAEALALDFGMPLPPGPEKPAAQLASAPGATSNARASDPVGALCRHFGADGPERLFIDCGSGVSCLGVEANDGRTYDVSVIIDHLDSSSSSSSSVHPGATVWRALSTPLPGYVPLKVTPASSLKLTLGVTLLPLPPPASPPAQPAAAAASPSADAAAAGADDAQPPPAKRPRLEGLPEAPPTAPAPAAPASHAFAVRAGLTRFPLFFQGRYKKYARGVSQSLWVVEGRRLGCPVSVEHLSAWVLAAGLAAGPARAAVPGAADAATGAAPPPLPRLALPPLLHASTRVDPRWATAPSGLVGGTPDQADAAEAALEALQHRIQHAILASPAHAVPGWGGGEVVEPPLYKSPDITLPATANHTWPTFHAAGREDVDVRMLGPGRPFVAEVANVRAGGLTLAALLGLQGDVVNAVNAHAGGLLRVSGLTPTTKEEFAALNAGASAKRKRYSAVCHTASPVTPEGLRAALEGRGKLAVTQWTPMRVLHRRPLLPRAKAVLDMVTEWIGPHYFVLHLVTSAGTYVKEFVHGDRGRTHPSVTALLGSDTDILQLDVTDLQEYGQRGGGGEGEEDDEDEDAGGGDD